jgi:hypothetical protein
MAGHGYDEVKWAEGQSVLAELVSNELATEPYLVSALRWYDEAVVTAREALSSRPQLLAKLGVAGEGIE